MGRCLANNCITRPWGFWWGLKQMKRPEERREQRIEPIGLTLSNRRWSRRRERKRLRKIEKEWRALRKQKEPDEGRVLAIAQGYDSEV